MNNLQVIPVAALISATVTLFIRFIDKPRPAITLESQYTRSETWVRKWEEEEGIYLLTVAIVNGGDGPAYGLEVHGDGCSAGYALPKYGENTSERYDWKIPVLLPSKHVLVYLRVPRENDSAAKLVIRWTRSPGRWWRWIFPRKKEVKISELETAFFLPISVVPAVQLPTRLRRWRRLERYTYLGQIKRGVDLGEQAPQETKEPPSGQATQPEQ